MVVRRYDDVTKTCNAAGRSLARGLLNVNCVPAEAGDGCEVAPSSPGEAEPIVFPFNYEYSAASRCSACELLLLRQGPVRLSLYCGSTSQNDGL